MEVKLWKIMVNIFWLVILILSHQVIVIFRLVVFLRNGVPSLMLVELSPPHHMLRVDFAVNFTGVIVMREGIYALVIVSLDIYKRIVPQLR